MVTGVAGATPIIERFTMNYYYVPHQYLRDLLLCATPIFERFTIVCHTNILELPPTLFNIRYFLDHILTVLNPPRGVLSVTFSITF